MDVFSGKITQTVLKTWQKEDILLSRVPTEMTHIYNFLDLTLNGERKAFYEENV